MILADKATRGWQIAHQLTAAQSGYGIHYLIWQGQIWTAESTPVVLADLLGLHIVTATTWAEEAAGNWSDYAVTRAIHTRP